MMHFRMRTLNMPEKQAAKYVKKYNKWRKGKRFKRFRKHATQQEGR